MAKKKSGGKSGGKSSGVKSGGMSGGASSRGSSDHMISMDKEKEVRQGNISAAKAIADAVRTSLGPRGMDKMIQSPDGEVTVSNDGATILSKLEVFHPAAKLLVDLSKSQDVEAGDGTTSVVVICGALLGAAQSLLDKGIHPSIISNAFRQAESMAQQVLKDMSVTLDLLDREQLLRAATTSLNSKVVNQYSNVLAPIAVDAVMRVLERDEATNVDLRSIRRVKRTGGTIDDTELIDGLVFANKASHVSGAPTSVADAKIALIQFCLSPPKTNLEHNVVISDYTQMDRVLKEERKYILKLCQAIKKTGANVLLVQKSILRDAVTAMSLHFLAKMNIMVVTDIERSDIDLVCRSVGCQPMASVEGLSADKLGTAKLVAEEDTPDGKLVRITGVPNPGRTVSVLVRGSNSLVLEEADRSLHDALCVVRSLVKKRFMTPGGGAPETEISVRLAEAARKETGLLSFCLRAYGEALEIIPYTLAENSGLNAIDIVSALKARHVAGDKNAGINVRKGTVSDILAENIVQPLLVNSSALSLATETVVLLLKVDDFVMTR
mmetsp:Transcript_6757/g.21815  ORF Transcript_6757/g.21815 Transcript_6757/m.21815 type:complete len:552 (-) Transcript_6757:66-1721(-)